MFQFQPNADGVLTMDAAVCQALGAASVCWEETYEGRVFQPGRAMDIADKLIGFIHGYRDSQPIERGHIPDE